jgi:hypothetical protein
MGGLFDIFVAYKFIKILATPWKKTDAYKLGIIDEKGGVLKARKDLKTSKEKKAYTVVHTLIWNLKKLLDKLPPTRTKLGSFAVALWLLKEKKVKIKESTFEDIVLQNVSVDDEFKGMINESSYSAIENGTYRATESTEILYSFINEGDSIIVENNKPINNLLGVDLYEAYHKKTGKMVVISNEEIF